MSKDKRILYVVNPVSGTKSKEAFLQSLKERMSSSPYDWQLLTTERRGHATELAATAAAEGVDVVVAIGGDGTVNEVGCGLAGSETALGIIPMGSGNGLARDLGISMRPTEALDYLLANLDVTSHIDRCVINGKSFFCTSGTGFDARVSSEYARRNAEGHRGLITYVRAAVKEWFAKNTRHLRISFDGEQTVDIESFLLTFANASQYGNDAFIAPRASMRDGLIDVVVIKPIHIWNVPRLAYQLFKKKIDRNKHVFVRRAKKVVLETDNAEPFHFDGDNGEPTNRFEVEIIQASLKVVGD